MATSNATTYCPICNAQGGSFPILSPLEVFFTGPGKYRVHPETKAKTHDAELNVPHFCYKCAKCGYAEIHERLVENLRVERGSAAEGM